MSGIRAGLSLLLILSATVWAGTATATPTHRHAHMKLTTTVVAAVGQLNGSRIQDSAYPRVSEKKMALRWGGAAEQGKTRESHWLRAARAPQLALQPDVVWTGGTLTARVTASRAKKPRVVLLEVFDTGKWRSLAKTTTRASTVKFSVQATDFPSNWSMRAEVGGRPTSSETLYVTSSVLGDGQRLQPGVFLTSSDGRYCLTMQSNGGLVESVATSGRALWTAPGTAGHPGAWAVQQGDGNLVVYPQGGGNALWSSGSAGHSDDGHWFTGLQPDANLVVYDGSTPYWADNAQNTEVAGNELLLPGWYIHSPDGHYTLTMQSDGNLVETVNSGSHRPIWSSNTAGHPGAWLGQFADGNLAITYQGAVIWQTKKSGSGMFTALQNDSNIVQYDSSGAPWASNTVNDTLVAGETLVPGQYIWSNNGAYELVMQADGNLVQYHGSATWASNTAGHPGAWAVMQGDGNFVIYPPGGGNALWSTGTAGDNGAYIANQGDGNIVVYLNGVAKWASHSGGGGPTAAETAAMNWARGELGSNAWDGLCLTFTFDAWSAAGINLRSWVNIPITSNTYASDIWGHFTHGTTGGGSTPPAGSLVFFASKTGDRTLSHVALSVGNGELVSTDDGVAPLVHLETMAQHSYAIELGWWLPDG